MPDGAAVNIVEMQVQGWEAYGLVNGLVDARRQPVVLAFLSREDLARIHAQSGQLLAKEAQE